MIGARRIKNCVKQIVVGVSYALGHLDQKCLLIKSNLPEFVRNSRAY